MSINLGAVAHGGAVNLICNGTNDAIGLQLRVGFAGRSGLWRERVPTHHFGNGSFRVELWIAGKAPFNKLQAIDVEFESAGAFDWVFADANGNEVRTYRHQNPAGGWTSIHLPSLGIGGNLSVGFRNVSGGEKKIRQGDVHYG